jgi:hypothetical protein
MLEQEAPCVHVKSNGMSHAGAFALFTKRAEFDSGGFDDCTFRILGLTWTVRSGNKCRVRTKAS